MRLLKFIGVFLGTLIIIGAIIVIPAWNSIKTIFSKSTPLKAGMEWVNKTGTERGFVNYLKAKPENGSFSSIDITYPDSSISYQDTLSRPMGAVSNFLLIIEYARQVDSGIISPDESIPLSKINRFLLPGDNVSNHEEAMQFLKDSKRIRNGSEIKIEDIPLMIIRYDDEAAADYLYMRLGTSNLDSLSKNFNCKSIEPPLPWSGLALAESLPSNEPDSLRFARLFAMSRTEFRKLVIAKTDSLDHFPAYRLAMEKKLSAVRDNISFQLLNASNRLLPKSTTRAMSGLLSRALHDSLINSHVSRLVLDALQWKTHNPSFDARYTYYGGLFGQRVGMLTGLNATVSRDTGEKYVQAAFLENIPLALWLHLSSEFMNQNFMQRMTADPPFHTFAFKRLKNPE